MKVHRSLGRACAVRLAMEGADLVLADVCGPLPEVDHDSATPADLDETVALVETEGRRAVAGQVDVRDPWPAHPHLVRAGAGSIVLISSAAGLKVQPFMVPYTTSKFAVRGMAKAFAAELAQHGVRVNSVHPTGMATPMGTGDMQAALRTAMAGDPRLGGMFANLMPVDITRPEDVAHTVLFLASDESRFVTAHELAPDAGVTEF